MKYIDRKGNITIEENEQDKFLRHLYNDRGGRLCLKLLIRPFVSKAAGVLRRREYQSANPTGESWETDCSGLSEGHEKS